MRRGSSGYSAASAALMASLSAGEVWLETFQGYEVKKLSERTTFSMDCICRTNLGALPCARNLTSETAAGRTAVRRWTALNASALCTKTLKLGITRLCSGRRQK